MSSHHNDIVGRISEESSHSSDTNDNPPELRSDTSQTQRQFPLNAQRDGEAPPPTQRSFPLTRPPLERNASEISTLGELATIARPNSNPRRESFQESTESPASFRDRTFSFSRPLSSPRAPSSGSPLESGDGSPFASSPLAEEEGDQGGPSKQRTTSFSGNPFSSARRMSSARRQSAIGPHSRALSITPASSAPTDGPRRPSLNPMQQGDAGNAKPPRRVSFAASPFGDWSFRPGGSRTDSSSSEPSDGQPGSAARRGSDPTLPRAPPKARAKSYAFVPRRASSFTAEGRVVRSWSIAGRMVSNGEKVVEMDPASEEFQELLRRESINKTIRRGSVTSLGYYVRKHEASAMPIGSTDQKLISTFMDLAKERADEFKRPPYMAEVFRWGWLLFCLAFVYFVFVGMPLWKGAIYSSWIWISSTEPVAYGFLIFLGWGIFISWVPLIFTRFEKEVDDVEKRDSSQTCLLIPAYKAAGVLPATIEHALKIFRPHQIFILANGNSPTPLDNTADVCKQYGVNHAWIPIGSKIAAEFVGVVLARKFKYALLIDDDVHLPANMPLVTDRFNDEVKCIGYTIKSTGADGAKGTYIQQCQDIEYKLSGLARTFGGDFGSATFPHGAIILWDRDILEQMFWGHPGYKISEDWFFGHTLRSAGYRISFCTQVFVETETPPSLFMPAKSSRGGYGEMTVWKQRFYRWNFFFLYRLWHDCIYLLFAWKLGFRELVTKLWVLQEVYATCLYMLMPFWMPIMLAAQPKMTLIMMAALIGVYIVAVVFFNAYHLRRKNEMVAWRVFPAYFAMKFALNFVNALSTWYSVYAYADYFSKKHPRVFEDFAALSAAKECLENVKKEEEAEEQKLNEKEKSLSVSSSSSLEAGPSTVRVPNEVGVAMG